MQTSVKSSSINPYWDEKFTFNINQGNEDLKVVVMDKAVTKADAFEG